MEKTNVMVMAVHFFIITIACDHNMSADMERSGCERCEFQILQRHSVSKPNIKRINHLLVYNKTDIHKILAGEPD